MTPEQRARYYMSKDVEPGSLEAEIGETIRWAIAEEREACAKVAEGYMKENVCGDECLTRTVVSDIYHDIKDRED